LKLVSVKSAFFAGALAWALLASGCSFNRAWNAAGKTSAPANDIQGRWDGVWLSEVNDHTGKLRCLVTKQAEGKYHARYHAQYRKIFSFGYTVTLEGKQTGGSFVFSGDADLGWYAGGIYHYEGHANNNYFFSTYRSQYDHGTFQMSRLE